MENEFSIENLKKQLIPFGEGINHFFEMSYTVQSIFSNPNTHGKTKYGQYLIGYNDKIRYFILLLAPECDWKPESEWTEDSVQLVASDIPPLYFIK